MMPLALAQVQLVKTPRPVKELALLAALVFAIPTHLMGAVFRF